MAGPRFRNANNRSGIIATISCDGKRLLRRNEHNFGIEKSGNQAKRRVNRTGG